MVDEDDEVPERIFKGAGQFPQAARRSGTVIGFEYDSDLSDEARDLRLGIGLGRCFRIVVSLCTILCGLEVEIVTIGPVAEIRQ